MTSSDKNIYVEALKKDNAELTKQYYDVLKKYSEIFGISEVQRTLI